MTNTALLYVVFDHIVKGSGVEMVVLLKKGLY